MGTFVHNEGRGNVRAQITNELPDRSRTMPPECRRCLTHHADREPCRMIGIEGRLRARVERLTMENKRLQDERQSVIAAVSVYGGGTLHAALDAVGVLMDGRAS